MTNIKHFSGGIDLNSGEAKNLSIHLVQSLPINNVFTGMIVYLIPKSQYYYHDGFVFRPFQVNQLKWKESVRLAVSTNTNLSTVQNGDIVDGETIVTGDRVLFFGQTNATENGVYTIGSAPGNTVRSNDFNDATEFMNSIIGVYEGSESSNAFQCITENPNVGTDEIIFVRFSISSDTQDATESTKGILRFGNQQEVIDGLLNNVGVSPATLKVRLQDIEAAIENITPGTPPDLSATQLTLLSPTYNAREEGSGTIQECTDNLLMEAEALEFFDGDNGVLQAFINTLLVGEITLTENDDTGINAALHITADDPDATGIYSVLSAKIAPTENLTIGQQNYQLFHTLTGAANKQFFTDDPGTVTTDLETVIDPTFGSPAEIAANYKYISGVPSINPANPINVTYNIINAVNSHYAETYIGRLTGDGMNTLEVPVPASPPASGSTVSVSEALSIINNTFIDKGINFGFFGYNSKKEISVESTVFKNYHIDSVSDETPRSLSGLGDFPVTYGGLWDSEVDISTLDELQMLNGKYQYPVTDYSDLDGLVGPNYSGLSGYKWVTFKYPTSLTDNSGLQVEFPNTEGDWTGSNKITSNIKLFVKVDGATGWIDGNNPYNGVSTPVNDGDAAMIADNNTSYISKKITFGPATRSGDLYVRVGLPETSDKRFSNINIIPY